MLVVGMYTYDCKFFECHSRSVDEKSTASGNNRALMFDIIYF